MQLKRTISTGTIALTLGLALSGCGSQADPEHVSKPNIIGGKKVQADTTPAIIAQSTVALATQRLIDGEDAFCSGTLISRRVVLTAAHCVVDANGRAPTGDEPVYVVFGLKVEKTSPRVRVIRTRPHPQYRHALAVDPNPAQAPNDIALIYLEKDAPEPTKYKPAPLSDVSLAAGADLNVAGYGVDVTPIFSDSSGRLRTAKVPVSSVQQKAKRLETAVPLKGVCSGDSGGPAFARNARGGYVVAGVTSSGAAILTVCAGLNLFTDVSAYRGWIQQNL